MPWRRWTSLRVKASPVALDLSGCIILLALASVENGFGCCDRRPDLLHTARDGSSCCVLRSAMLEVEQGVGLGLESNQDVDVGMCSGEEALRVC